MKTEQPEALRLADLLTADAYWSPMLGEQAATELRRLHEVNQELLEALKELVEVSAHLDACQGTVEQARAAIAKAGEQA